MMPWELGVASLLYAVVACRYSANGEVGMSLAFFSYALANVGFIVTAWR